MGDANREEIAKLEALYANNPGGRVFTHLAEAYRKAGELEAARTILEDGLARHSDSASAHVVLGRVLLDQGATAEASSAFRRVLELDPENRVALRTLGDLNQGSGSRTDALEYYNRLQALDPGDDDLANLIARLSQEPEPVAAETPGQVPEVAPAEPVAQVEPAREPEPVVTAPQAGEPERTPQAVADTVDSGFALDWTGAEPASQEALPGDLAGFAQETQPDGASAETAPTRETIGFQSTFEEIVTAGVDTSSADSGFEEPEPASNEAEEAPLDFPFGRVEPEPAAQESNDPWGAERGEPVQPWSESAPPGVPQSNVGSSVESPRGGDAEPAEPWVDLPPPLEAPEGWTPSPEPPEAEVAWKGPWTESFDLNPDLPDVEGESAEPAPAGAQPSELSVDPSAEEAREASFEAMLSSSVGESGTAAEAPEEDLPTETLAELYRTQGFYDRAIEVYRALLENRPDDVRLQARLREVQQLEARQAGIPEDKMDEADEEAREAWMAGVASAWTVQETQAPAGAPGLYSWTDEPGDGADGSGPNLRDYLSKLLSWRPTPEIAPPHVATAATPQPRDEPAQPEPQPVKAEAQQLAPPARAPEPEPELGIEHDLPVLTLDEEVPGEPGLAASLMDWQPPFEESATQDFADREPEAPVGAARARTGNPVEDAFDEWFNADEPTAVPDHAVEARAQDVAPQQTRMTEPTPPLPEPTPAAEESDDDLEMFRSWLQSLKR